MSKRIGEKRSRSIGGRESDPKAPPRKLSRMEEEDLDEGDNSPEFSFSQVGAQSQDELEAEQRTKGMKMVSGESDAWVWLTAINLDSSPARLLKGRCTN